MNVLYGEQEGAIKCPYCGYENLHHSYVEVYSRDEDEKKGVRTVCGHKSTMVDTDLEGNPSGRRDGLKVYFYCEQCPKKPSLSIYQHKGSTFMEWDA